MQYNESLYNGDSYNLTNYTSTLTESVTPTDATLTFSVGIVKTDSQGTADALSDGVTLAALLDTVTIYQHARTPFAYNNGMYNQFMYNARLDEDEILLMAIKALDEAITLSDGQVPFSVIKALTESFTETDTLTFDLVRLFTEAVFLDDDLTKQITNKGLSDSLRLSDWVSINRKPQSDDWAD